MMKKSIAIVMALLMTLALCACTGNGSGTKSSDPNLGVYKATTGEMSGFEVALTDMFEQGFSIELKEKGKCDLVVDGQKASGKYTIDGNSITIKGGGMELSGTIGNGVMKLDYSGVTFTFVNDAYQAPASNDTQSGASFSAEETKPEAKNPELGVYTAVTLIEDGIEVPADMLFENGFTIELKDGGACEIISDGDVIPGAYKLDGTAISLDCGEIQMQGTLENDLMRVEYDGLTIVLNKGAVSTAASDKPSDAPAATDAPAQQSAEKSNTFWIVAYSAGSMKFEGSDLKDLGVDETYLVLNDDHTATLVLAGEVMDNMTWNETSLMIAGIPMYSYAYVDEDTIDLDVFGMLTYTLKRADAPITGSEPQVIAPEPQVSDAADYDVDWWTGKWYGWFIVSDASESYAQYVNIAFDQVAELTYDGDSGRLSIWDYQNYKTEDPADDMIVRLEKGSSEVGKLVYVSDADGTFFADWECDPAEGAVAIFDHMIEIHATHTDPDGEYYTYWYFLRPWGMDWEDVRATYDVPGLQYKDMMPIYYDEWYVEAAGISGANNVQAPIDAPDVEMSGVLDVNGKGAVLIYYPEDQFYYDDDYGKLKNSETGVGILIDPMLGSTNLEELKKSYEEHNSKEDDYSLTETTINGYRAIIMTYSDWLGSTMRVDIDFGGSHDGFYGMSFAVSGYSLADCDTDVVWAIIRSMQVVK